MRFPGIQPWLVSVVLLVCCSPLAAENWPAWRGPRGDGTSQEENVPVKWDGKTGENVAWKVELPGVGHASPIVWEDRVFLTACLKDEPGDKKPRVLLCLDGKSGKTVWQRTVFESLLETKHELNSFASGTPTTDGKLIFTTFLEVGGETIPAPNVGAPRQITPGKMVVAAHDLEGNLKWLARPGGFISAHGYCSSPVLYEDLVIVNGDHDGEAYIVALNRETGEEVWRTERKYGIRSYVTPIIREIGGRTQMILSGSKRVTSYDPASGKLHWLVEGPTEQFVASMVDCGDLVLLTAGFPEYHILAIDPTGSGDVTGTHIAWRTKDGAAYVPSPVAVGEYFLLVSDGGVASCFVAENGDRLWKERIGTGFSASAVAAGGLAYFPANDGTMTVVRPGPEFEVVAKNELGENCYASPAISGGKLFIRGEKSLYCVGE